MSKIQIRKGADRLPSEKGLGLTAWLALIGFALLGAAELTGNQASLQMKPAVNLLYGKGLTDVLSSVSSWTVAGALLLISLGLASRLTDMQAVAGFGIMSSIYVVLGLFVLPGGVAITLAGLVGVFSVVIAFVRDAANRVAPDKPVAGNQIVSGGMVILSQFAPVGVAASGVAFGAQRTYLFVSIMLAGACVLGAFLFRRYPRPQADANVKTSHAWNAQSVRLTIINFVSAVAVGAAFGPFFEDVHRRGLDQSIWVLIWGLAGVVVGFFLIFIWSFVTHGLRDRGLFIAALVTLVGAVFEVMEHHQTSGTVLVAGGITVSLGANAFEAAVYDRPTTPGENIVKNFGRALGFGLGAFFALRLVSDMQYAWLILGSAAIGVLLTFMLRKHWVQPVAPEVARNWKTKAAIVFGASIFALLALLAAGVSIIVIALLFGGAAILGAVVFVLLHLRGWIRKLLGITALEEMVRTLEADRQRDAGRVGDLEAQVIGLQFQVSKLQETLHWTRMIIGLPDAEARVSKIIRRFSTSRDKFMSDCGDSFWGTLDQFSTIRATLARPEVSTQELLTVRTDLDEIEQRIKHLRRSYAQRVAGMLRKGQEGLNAISNLHPLVSPWLSMESDQMETWSEILRLIYQMDLTLLQQQWDEMDEAHTEARHTRSQHLDSEEETLHSQVEALRAERHLLNGGPDERS